MNGKWQPWSIGVNGNTAAQYVTAWRHAHDIFRRDRRHERALAGRTLAPVAPASAIAYADRTPRGEAPFDPPGVTRLDRLLASGRPGVR